MDKVQELKRYNSWLFGFNRRRPVSFMNQDHGYRDGGDPMVWLADMLEAVGVDHPRGAVWLQTFPRMLGYVFNPVSFWYLYDIQGDLRVIVAAVNNTFGQRHQYVLTAPAGMPIQTGQVLTCQKVFHVSPFCPVTGHYRFERSIKGQVDCMAIDYFDDDALAEPLIRTGIAVTPEPFHVRKLLAAFAKMPFMTFGVMLRIHWHALKLWRNGATFHRLPQLPTIEVTSNQEPQR
jgi:DUF1365 family protein